MQITLKIRKYTEDTDYIQNRICRMYFPSHHTYQIRLVNQVENITSLKTIFQKYSKYGLIHNFAPLYLQYICQVLINYFQLVYNISHGSESLQIGNPTTPDYTVTLRPYLSTTDSTEASSTDSTSGDLNNDEIEYNPPTTPSGITTSTQMELEGQFDSFQSALSSPTN